MSDERRTALAWLAAFLMLASLSALWLAFGAKTEGEGLLFVLWSGLSAIASGGLVMLEVARSP